MKKSIKTFALVAGLATAILSCDKESTVPAQQQEGLVLTFASEMPDREETDSRTAFNSSTNTIDWSAQDAIRVGVTINDVWMAKEGAPASGAYPKLYQSDHLAAAAHTAQFKVNQFALNANGTYKFYGLYPAAQMSGTNFENAPLATINIPAIQTPPSGSFDNSADVMWAVSGDYEGIPNDRLIDLEWTRIVAHGDITLKNLPVFENGETLSSVTLTAQSSADLAGAHALNITNGAVALLSGVANTPSIKINLDNQSLDSNTNTLEFWFVSLPFTATSLTVALETNKKIYTKTYANISKQFLANRRNTLGISMSNATSQDILQTGQVIPDGDYMIAFIGEHNNTQYNVMMLSEYLPGSSSALNFGTLPANYADAPSKAIWTFSYQGSGMYTIQSADNAKYLLGSASSTSLEMRDAQDRGTFKGEYFDNTATTYKLTVSSGNDTRGLGFNTQQNRFAMYAGTSSAQPIELNLIPIVGEPVTLSFAEVLVTLTSSNYSSFTGQSVSANPNVPAINGNISYAMSGDAIGTINPTTGDVTLNGSNGQAIVTATFAGDNYYRRATAAYTISVSGPEIWSPVESVAELSDGLEILIANANGTKVMGQQNTNNRAAVDASPVAGTNNISVSSNSGAQIITLEQTGSNWYFCVGEDQYLFAAGNNNNKTLKTSTKSNANNNNCGKWNISLSNSTWTVIAQGNNDNRNLRYNSTSSLFSCYSSGQTAIKLYKHLDNTVWNLTGISVTTQPTKTTYTEGECFDPAGMVVTASYVDANDVNHTKTAPVNHADLSFNPSTSTPLTTANTSITITHNGQTTSQSITVNPLYTITLVTMTHGSVTASTASAVAGASVTLTISPDNGYQLNTITVTNTTTNQPVTLSGSGNTRTFTMPASAVTVNATFVAASTKTYKLTIDASSFNTNSYDANNNEKITTATEVGGSGTFEVHWTSHQVMKNSNNMQWQKNKGYIYNSTNLGSIKSVTVTSSAGTFTTYYGSSQQPSSNTSVGTGNGYFQTKVGNATGTTSKMEIVFER